MLQIENIDWITIYESLSKNGYAVIPSFLTNHECNYYSGRYFQTEIYRSVIEMERYRFGKGQYKYFGYPLPDQLQIIRESFYKPLAVIANQWMSSLNTEIVFPKTHKELIQHCACKNQLRPTPLILRYEKDGFNTLHQDLYGEVYFPFQIVFPLSQQGIDFEGGEFILVEQLPRAQSKVEVVSLNKGDALIFTTNFRPIKGSKGFYKAKMKHGVSRLKLGERYALGVIFHDGN